MKRYVVIEIDDQVEHTEETVQAGKYVLLNRAAHSIFEAGLAISSVLPECKNRTLLILDKPNVEAFEKAFEDLWDSVQT